MTVDYESLATLLPITFTALFAIAFTIGLPQQRAASRKQARVTGTPNAPARGGQPDDSRHDLRIKSETEAAAIRMDRAGGKVWKREGDALTILHQLVELPEPSDPRAPRLVIGTAPRLWTP